MGKFKPGQMFDHTQIELSGRSMMYALDFAAPADSAEDVVINEGGVITLNDSGNFVAGLGDGVANVAVAHNAPMALFAIQGINDFDANSDEGNISGGVMSGLVASGGYEIQTTEFVTGTYGVNDLLTFGVTTNRGKIVLAADAYSTQHCFGIVSRGTDSNAYNKPVLSFWTTYLPAVKTS